MTHIRILRYPIDAVSVVAVLLGLSVQCTAYFQGWHWLAAFPLLLLVRHVHLVEHNHCHIPIFHQRMLNEILGWLCFLSNGIPLEFYELHHVHNHHRYNQRFDASKQDWSSLFGFTGTRIPDRPVHRGYYILTFP